MAWIEPLSPEMLVLDVACGAGHAADAIAPRVRQVVGIDLTPSLLALGAQRLLEQGIFNVLLQEGNAEALPFVDESFDLVLCRSSLHHFFDPRGAIAEIVRVCRRGGRIVLVELVAPAAEVRARFDEVHKLLDPSHVTSFVEAEVGGLLPGGIEALSYADTFDLRLPIDVAITEQSDDQAVRRILRDELAGKGEPTGLQPAEEDGQIVVSFTTCVVHGVRPRANPSG